ncbi:polynucleotide kinase [Morganella phage vB_MmoM_MP1]|uniref:3'-phosphatase, 5'-polynucleotide kinase n=1 Tax=Morganella phage vB_MmoM_MP1 TaxID=1852628 RepID=A0A192Y9M4_9CAUD|nr:polynucleotide kinase [Morganella phage vB_MmoM_MP1]ANM46439.1 3'-phosphatase, 5'-polynucleotide kinase [Morganella phage vB_MmoM_MP1]
MNKIIMTVGAPGSGKSTWAKEFCEANENAKEFNRDEIRCKFSGCKLSEYRYNKSNEKEVLNRQKTGVALWLGQNENNIAVISDTGATSKSRNRWIEFVKELGGEIEIEYKVFDVTLEELYRRNLHRGDKAVPNHRIYQLYQEVQWFIHGKPDWSKNEMLPKAIIVDIDGTIADNTKRNPHDLDSLHKDQPRQNVINHVNMMYQAGITVLITSGREKGDDDKHEIATRKWLDKYNVEYDKLIMRENKDSRKDNVVKKELFYKHIADRYNVLYVLDDRQQVVDMWRTLGLECWQVNTGNF